tara:strand:+ start:290 stop:421 length:132 start_codon:yes stop_codon:yes gene_type:complete
MKNVVLDWIFAPKDLAPMRWLVYVPVWMMFAFGAGVALRELVR